VYSPHYGVGACDGDPRRRDVSRGDDLLYGNRELPRVGLGGDGDASSFRRRLGVAVQVELEAANFETRICMPDLSGSYLG
jgi:hypothetical protein